jgi:hypothetical protein
MPFSDAFAFKVNQPAAHSVQVHAIQIVPAKPSYFGEP